MRVQFDTSGCEIKLLSCRLHNTFAMAVYRLVHALADACGVMDRSAGAAPYRAVQRHGWQLVASHGCCRTLQRCSCDHVCAGVKAVCSVWVSSSVVRVGGRHSAVERSARQKHHTTYHRTPDHNTQHPPPLNSRTPEGGINLLRCRRRRSRLAAACCRPRRPAARPGIRCL